MSGTRERGGEGLIKIFPFFALVGARLKLSNFFIYGLNVSQGRYKSYCNQSTIEPSSTSIFEKYFYYYLKTSIFSRILYNTGQWSAFNGTPMFIIAFKRKSLYLIHCTIGGLGGAVKKNLRRLR